MYTHTYVYKPRSLLNLLNILRYYLLLSQVAKFYTGAKLSRPLERPVFKEKYREAWLNRPIASVRSDELFTTSRPSSIISFARSVHDIQTRCTYREFIMRLAVLVNLYGSPFWLARSSGHAAATSVVVLR